MAIRSGTCRRGPWSLPDLETRTATTQAILASCGAILLAAGGLALGLEVGGPAAGVAGLLLPPGLVAIGFALREPPKGKRPEKEPVIS